MSDVADNPNPSLTAMQFLMRLQGGQFVQDLQEALTKVSAGVVDTGKAGEIGVKILVDVVKQAPNAVVFRTKLSEKVPKPAAQSDILFVGNEGDLHKADPKQREIQFGPRLAPSAPVAGKDFDPETGEVVSRRPSPASVPQLAG